MSENDYLQYTAVVNPAARKGRMSRDINRIARAFESAGMDVSLEVTERPNHATELARRASEAGRAVIAVGGDGTVHEVARGLLESASPMPMAVLPVGSGNDFARMIGMSNEIESAIRQIKGGNAQSVDTGRISFQEDGRELSTVFVNAVGIGFDGYVATVAPRFKGYPFGMGYFVSILVSLISWKSALALIEELSDGQMETIEDKIFFMTVGNARDSAGGYSITPKASIIDGKLDVCLVAAVSRLRALQILPSARSGGHLLRKEVRYWHSERIRFVPERPMPLHTDGEVQSQRVEAVEIWVEPGSLQVLVPVAHSLHGP